MTMLMHSSISLHGIAIAALRQGTVLTLADGLQQSAENLQGSFFGPYTPLQQLDILADYGTKSYIVGSTNSLLLQQKDKYSDILINLDDLTVNITSTSLRTALSLSPADRRWIDFLTQTVQDTWDADNPSRPTTMGYAGSEDFIRLQFEEYLLALLSSVSYQEHIGSPRKNSHAQSSAQPTPEEDPSLDFNSDFVHAWKETSNYALFTRLTLGSSLFDIIEPKHPTAGGLSVEDIQRRLAQQVAELHLDERVREGKETLGKHLALGKERFGQFSNKLWADIEAVREAQRKRSQERGTGSSEGSGAVTFAKPAEGGSPEGESSPAQASKRYAWSARPQAPDLAQVQASAKDASAKAGAYLSSWGSWARDKGKEWQEKRAAPGTVPSPPPRSTINLSTNAAPSEKAAATLSPTGSAHSAGSRLSTEEIGDRGNRWTNILRRSREGSRSRTESEAKAEPSQTTATAIKAATGRSEDSAIDESKDSVSSTAAVGAQADQSALEASQAAGKENVPTG
jgi:Transport protein Avl9